MLCFNEGGRNTMIAGRALLPLYVRGSENMYNQKDFMGEYMV